MKNFKELNLPPVVERALEAMQFREPTPIQAQAMPVALTGRDLIGCAQTGTGKTAAFCVPMLVRLLQDGYSTGLILTPTREIALQIQVVWEELTRFCPELRSALLIGGVSMQPQHKALGRRPRLLICTPGRLLDHLSSRNGMLAKTSVLVLDEADRMLDMGFAPQLNQVLRYLPKERQTLFFSATWPHEIDELSKRYLRNPEKVSVGATSRAAGSVRQSTIATNVQKKNETLLDEINKRQGSILVFARTQARTDRVARYLNTYGVECNRLHGGRSQGQRNSALGAFRSGQVRVLVATDIAARGIDVVDIAHVINYDLPMVAEDYIHRIGRTGRAGSEGDALSLLTPEDRPLWQEITRLLQKTGSATPTALPPAHTSAPAPQGGAPSQQPGHSRDTQSAHRQGERPDGNPRRDGRRPRRGHRKGQRRPQEAGQPASPPKAIAPVV